MRRSKLPQSRWLAWTLSKSGSPCLIQRWSLTTSVGSVVTRWAKLIENSVINITQSFSTQGIANGMFSHIMGYKHRQMFVEEMFKDDPKVLDLSQSELLSYARRYAENGDNLNDRIKTRRSDEVM